MKMNCINAIGDQKTKNYMYLSRRCLIKLVGFSSFGLGFWISACDQSNADSAPTVENNKESKMESAKTKASIKPTKPPIDDATPAVISTATFALG
jgi:hypothetical protein